MPNRINRKTLTAVSTLAAVSAAALVAGSSTAGYAASPATEAGQTPETTYLVLRPNEYGVDSDPVLAGSFTYKLHTTFRNMIDASTSLVVTAKPGVTGTISGQYRISDDFGHVDKTPRTYSAKIAPSATFTDKVGFNGDSTVLFESLTVTVSDGTRQTLTLKLRADQKLNPTGERFLITGIVTATGS